MHLKEEYTSPSLPSSHAIEEGSEEMAKELKKQCYRSIFQGDDKQNNENNGTDIEDSD